MCVFVCMYIMYVCLQYRKYFYCVGGSICMFISEEKNNFLNKKISKTNVYIYTRVK